MSPTELYKYRDDSEWTRKIIEDREVWLSLPRNLNDPLECHTGHVDVATKRKIVQRMEKGAILGLMTQRKIFSLTPEETSYWIRSVQMKSHSKQYEAVRQISARHGVTLSRPDKLVKDFERRVASVGIFSMSEDPNNELMWSHYAGQHTGLALGFSRSEGSLLEGNKTIQVSYHNNPRESVINGLTQQTELAINGKEDRVWRSRIPFESELFRSVISTKSSAWSYEKEWRYIEEEAGLQPWPGTLTSVTFGLKMKERDRQYYIDLVNHNLETPVAFHEIHANRNTTFERRRI